MIVFPVDITLAMLLRWVNLYVCAINSTDNSWKSFFSWNFVETFACDGASNGQQIYSSLREPNADITLFLQVTTVESDTLNKSEISLIFPAWPGYLKTIKTVFSNDILSGPPCKFWWAYLHFGASRQYMTKFFKAIVGESIYTLSLQQNN